MLDLNNYTKKTIEEITSESEFNIASSDLYDEYTGRKIAIFTDSHSMYEPTLAILEDIKKQGISEIYSLGDSVGNGPNPSEVFDLIEKYGVIAIAGNSEYYNILGIEPFPYIKGERIDSQNWTASKLGKDRISKLKVYPVSIDLIIGNKRIALCHFANDIRWDYHGNNSTFSYRNKFGNSYASDQFLYTNNDMAKREIDSSINEYGTDDKRVGGYLAAKEKPIFSGKRVTDYDAIIQGHVHFASTDRIENTDIFTLRAVGMGYENDPEDSACYYVLREKKQSGFDIEKRLVPFDRNSLIEKIYSRNIPDKKRVLTYIGL